jgi:beta-aspartyl-dipeptidase (metallo-type)
MQTLYEDVKSCIINKKIAPDIAFRFVTENVAKVLKLYPNKGILQEGSDADILITDQDFNIKKLFCRGKLLVNNQN